MRLAAATLIPLLFLGSLELGLRVLGYGYPTQFFVPEEIEGRDFYRPNFAFGLRFFPPHLVRNSLPLRMAAKKPATCYRIFLFGESAAYGDPDPTFGVGRYLQCLLRERYPGNDFEVVCVAMTAINSHAILPIARECARLDGDLWIIYMGNNEMVGPYGAGTVFGTQAPRLGFVRAILAIKSTRVGQLLEALTRGLRRDSSTARSWGGMDMFSRNQLRYNDVRRLRTYENFEGNLNDILRAGSKADVPILLSTVSSNLKDCAPFASLHGAPLDAAQLSEWDQHYRDGIMLEAADAHAAALIAYSNAAAIDPEFAELQFHIGRCHLALTNRIAAKGAFEMARDYDALAFRADGPINEIIRDAGTRYSGRGVHLLDAAEALAQGVPDEIPGFELFYEHVHLNFEGNYRLARLAAEQVKQLLPPRITARDAGQWMSSEGCDTGLALTVWDRLRTWKEVCRRVEAPPFTKLANHADYLSLCAEKRQEITLLMNFQSPQQAMQMYEHALAVNPDDNLLHANFAQFLESAGALPQAIAHASEICKLLPGFAGPHHYLGTLLLRGGRMREAEQHFSQAITLRPDFAQAQCELGALLANRGRTAEATRWFKRAIRSDPDYAASYLNLGFLEHNQGKLELAAANYQSAARLEPNGPADYFYRANIAITQHRPGEAIAMLRTVTEYKPDFWQARYLLGTQLASQGLGDEARVQFAEVIRHRPDYAPAHYQLGMILVSQGHLDQALAEFESTVKLDPSNRPALEQIEGLKAKLGIGDAAK